MRVLQVRFGQAFHEFYHCTNRLRIEVVIGGELRHLLAYHSESPRLLGITTRPLLLRDLPVYAVLVHGVHALDDRLLFSLERHTSGYPVAAAVFVRPENEVHELLGYVIGHPQRLQDAC
ncbi:MAG: hypothetical protein ABFD77_00860 [Thermotogota bacterium]